MNTGHFLNNTLKLHYCLMSHTELYLMPNKISNLTHPGWIPAEASIPFSRNAFSRPYRKRMKELTASTIAVTCHVVKLKVSNRKKCT